MGQVLDAYALVALIADEPAAPRVEELLRAGGVRITSISLAEAVDVSCRAHGIAEEAVADAIDPLVYGGYLDVVAPDAAGAWRAASLRVAHYRRRERPLSIADCFLLAAAQPGDRIATADPLVAEVARAEGIEVLALPDSSGACP